MIAFALMLGCAAEVPFKGEYGVHRAGENSAGSCRTGGLWYLSLGDITELRVKAVRPGASFVFDVMSGGSEYNDIPCTLDDSSFACELSFDGPTYVDDLNVAGIWTPDSKAEGMWSVVRTCLEEEEWCNNMGSSRNCGFAEHVRFEPEE